MRRFVIVKPGCNEFANHLLNYLSVYASGEELGVSVVNPSFYPYHRFFNLVRHESLLTRILSTLAGLLPSPLWRIPYALYARRVGKKALRCARHAWRGYVHLPPTHLSESHFEGCETEYLFGWLYRNPVGLARYRDRLLKTFTPHTRVREKAEKIIAPLRGRKLIGIHVRQEPYTGFPDGEFLVSPKRVRTILDEYLKQQHLMPDEVALIVVSDRSLPEHTFDTFSTQYFRKTDPMNLFLLSECDVVIGTNTTFCFLSSWFGDIPHIVTTDEEIDWGYYRGKETYFGNKYATFVLGMPAAQSVHESHLEA